MKGFTREELLGLSALRPTVEWVSTPELGADRGFWVKGMSGTDRDTYQSSIIHQRGKKSSVDMVGMTAKLVVRCLVTDEGGQSRLFNDDDVALVGSWRGDVLGRLHDAGKRLSGMDDDEAETLGNGSGTQSGTSSSSASPLSSERV